jgi:hypothetical protein
MNRALAGGHLDGSGLGIEVSWVSGTRPNPESGSTVPWVPATLDGPEVPANPGGQAPLFRMPC